VGHVQFVHVQASHVSLQFGQLHWVSLSMSTSPDSGIAMSTYGDFTMTDRQSVAGDRRSHLSANPSVVHATTRQVWRRSSSWLVFRLSLRKFHARRGTRSVVASVVALRGITRRELRAVVVTPADSAICVLVAELPVVRIVQFGHDAARGRTP